MYPVTVTAAGQTGLGAPLAHPSTEGRDLHSGVPYQPYPLTQHISQTSMLKTVRSRMLDQLANDGGQRPITAS